MLLTKCPSTLKFYQRAKELNSDHDQNLEETRKGKAVLEIFEPASSPPFPSGFLIHETRADRSRGLPRAK